MYIYVYIILYCRSMECVYEFGIYSRHKSQRQRIKPEIGNNPQSTLDSSCQEYHDQKKPQISLLYAGGSEIDNKWFVHWEDMRSSGKADLVNLYGQAIQVADAMTAEPLSLIPDQFYIGEAYPNPFNGTVHVDIAVPSLQPVDIAIFNILGQIVYQEKLLPITQGIYPFSWNGKDLLQQDVSSGVYLINVTASEFQSIRKITYIK